MEDIEYDIVGTDSKKSLSSFKTKCISDHTIFFWLAGLSTLLPFTTLISMDDFWKKNFRDDATNFYPFFSNGAGLVALVFFDKINKRFGFKS